MGGGGLQAEPASWPHSLPFGFHSGRKQATMKDKLGWLKSVCLSFFLLSVCLLPFFKKKETTFYSFTSFGVGDVGPRDSCLLGKH